MSQQSDSDRWPNPFPVSYQDINDLAVSQKDGFNPSELRFETIRRISALTARPLICYVARTHAAPLGAPVSIDDGDLIGFDDLTRELTASEIDICMISNGGSAEAAERIVELLRGRFQHIRFLLPGNAYSAATLICFSGDELIMGPLATLGPIDPQVNGSPARAILRGFEAVEEKLRQQGAKGLTAYMPLLAKYELHLLEICKSAAELSEELAREWLTTYMLKCKPDDETVEELVRFFSDYDERKSHGRSIGRAAAASKGLKVIDVERSTEGLANLLTSLYNQYEFFIEKTPFVKLFENGTGVHWGRQAQAVPIQIPIGGMPLPPGKPARSGSAQLSRE